MTYIGALHLYGVAMHLSSLHLGAWAALDDDTEITSTNSHDMITLLFGAGHQPSFEISFSGPAMDRLIQVATESRARLRPQ
jgi:hypothetical protein